MLENHPNILTLLAQLSCSKLNLMMIIENRIIHRNLTGRRHLQQVNDTDQSRFPGTRIAYNSINISLINMNGHIFYGLNVLLFLIKNDINVIQFDNFFAHNFRFTP